MSAMRFAFSLSLLFVVMLSVAGVFLSSNVDRQVRQDIDDELLLEAELLLEDLQQFETVSELNVLLRDMAEFDFDTVLALRLNSGQVFGPVHDDVFDTLGYATISEDQLFVTDYLHTVFIEFWEFDALPTDAELDEILQEVVFDAKWRVYVQDFPAGRVAVFLPIDEVEGALLLIPTILIPVGILLVLSSLIGGAILGALQQKRMRRISDGLDRIANGVLDQPIAPARQKDDIDDIMRQVDQTAERLDVSIRQMRDFSHNVAHELRTPLTKLRAALDDPSGKDGQENALRHADELIRIFDALQRIARLKQKPSSGSLSAVDLADIADLMGDLYADVAEDNGQELTVITTHRPAPMGDQQLLTQALSNLVENALRHAGPNARITVETTPDGIRVWDTGAGISAADLARVTEPFQHGQVSAGTGLGLALVKAIADYHSAYLSLSSGQNGVSGLDAQLTFQTP